MRIFLFEYLDFLKIWMKVIFNELILFVYSNIFTIIVYVPIGKYTCLMFVYSSN